MASRRLTESELLVLGLVAEMPRHGYELEQVLELRVMRQWTSIGFSSIYFVLSQLEKKGLIRNKARGSDKAARSASPRTRKTYTITAKGRTTLVRATQTALTTVPSVSSGLSMGMLHWSVLNRDQALQALEQRRAAVDNEMKRVADIRLEQQPLPDHVDAIFDYTLRLLDTELEWINRTLDYMQSKPWPE